MTFAIYRRDKSYLGDVEAPSQWQAMIKGKSIWGEAFYAIQVVPGNDLGVRGL